MKKSRKSISVNAARWISYAAAGAATAFAASNDAEGAILYSGPINITLGSNVATTNLGIGNHATFYFKSIVSKSHLGAGSIGYVFHQFAPSPDKKQRFVSNWLAPVGGAEIGFSRTHVSHTQFGGHHTTHLHYASKLAFGAHISAGVNFNAANFGFGLFKGGKSGSYFSASNPGQIGGWPENSTGYLGFKFNDGAGVQYGWMRVTLSQGYKNWVTIDDYAYGAVNEAIFAGEGTPEPASLGLLASGALGLLALRSLGRGIKKNV